MRVGITGRNSIILRFIRLHSFSWFDIGSPVMVSPWRAVHGKVFRNRDIMAAVGQHEMSNLKDLSHSLRPSEGRWVWQLTIRRKTFQSTISPQNPPMPKAVS